MDVSFEAITALYNNPHDLTVLPSTKLKLQARSIIQQIIDERYTRLVSTCPLLDWDQVELMSGRLHMTPLVVPGWHHVTGPASYAVRKAT